MSMSTVERWLLGRVAEAVGNPPVRLVLKGLAAVEPPRRDPVATVVIQDRKTLAWLVLDPEIAFGDGYASGQIEIQGDLVRVLEEAYHSIAQAGSGFWYSKPVTKLLDWKQANTLTRSRWNIHHHYDLNADFYGLWLDEARLYTCAYFPDPSATLEDAQIAKMDHVCRKLELRPGETVIEAGCGWGAFALHMARNYGVSVRAFNISHEQIVFARRWAEREGLSGRVEFIEDDYRNINGHSDVFVSLGMLEHVGVEHYEELGNLIERSIGKSGRGLLHFIGRSHKTPLSRWIRKRIFPGAYPPTLSEALQIFEPRSFPLWDVENLRPHYAKTLEHWLARFEKSSDQICSVYGENFMRAWRLYLAGSLVAFRTGAMELFQVLFGAPEWKPRNWTRAAIYGLQPPQKEPACIPAMS